MCTIICGHKTTQQGKQGRIGLTLSNLNASMLAIEVEAASSYVLLLVHFFIMKAQPNTAKRAFWSWIQAATC